MVRYLRHFFEKSEKVDVSCINTDIFFYKILYFSNDFFQNDILINEVIKRFTPNPVLVIIQAASSRQDLTLPTDAYVEVQEVHDVSNKFEK